MKNLAIAVFATLLVAGCGFVDDDIHLSDEQLQEELQGTSGLGSITLSGYGSHSSSCGCGIGIGHSSRRHTYNFGSSDIFGRRPELERPVRAVGGLPAETFAATQVELEDPKPVAADPIPRNIETWGELVEWHFENAKRRGEVEAETEAAVDAMRK